MSSQIQVEEATERNRDKTVDIKEYFSNNRSVLGLFGALLLLMMFFSIAAPNFLTIGNFIDVLRQMSMIAIIAIGMTFVIITGEIDLSVGSLVAASSAILGFLAIQASMNIWLAIIITMVIGGLSGYSVAFLRNRYGIPSFITTLGWLSVWRGVAYLVTGGFPITPYPESFSFIGSGFIGPIPVTVIIMVALFAIFYYVLNKTTFGRYVYATGSNMKAAQLSGVPVTKVKVAVFVITGVLTAIAGIILSSRLMSSTPTVANGWELDVIAAVIVGGTSLFGGRGSLIGTFLGALFIAILGNGMVLIGVSPYMQLVIKGSIIVLAVLLSAMQTYGWRGQQKDIA
ncbi:ABC transporter permease [Alkalihalobacillus oceani]|uniref:ABC transporter permease n=1 Tax=Halalkalibacter oceani TaxID=1653776 RepID=A0A9X2DU87_9BACI|nr:ABC transporter permease [Halalkalibacter oceani]MCM3715513.1 ABC transporter permease [Halalkalibacter oceani]